MELNIFSPKHKKIVLILLSAIIGTLTVPSLEGKGLSFFGMLLCIFWVVLAMSHKSKEVLAITSQIIMIAVAISLSLLGTTIFFEIPKKIIDLSSFTAVSLSLYSLVLHYWRTGFPSLFKNKKKGEKKEITISDPEWLNKFFLFGFIALVIFSVILGGYLVLKIL